jgi:hypothetical protein
VSHGRGPSGHVSQASAAARQELAAMTQQLQELSRQLVRLQNGGQGDSFMRQQVVAAIRTVQARMTATRESAQGAHCTPPQLMQGGTSGTTVHGTASAATSSTIMAGPAVLKYHPTPLPTPPSTIATTSLAAAALLKHQHQQHASCCNK